MIQARCLYKGPCWKCWGQCWRLRWCLILGWACSSAASALQHMHVCICRLCKMLSPGQDQRGHEESELLATAGYSDGRLSNTHDSAAGLVSDPATLLLLQVYEAVEQLRPMGAGEHLVPGPRL